MTLHFGWLFHIQAAATGKEQLPNHGVHCSWNNQRRCQRWLQPLPYKRHPHGEVRQQSTAARVRADNGRPTQHSESKCYVLQNRQPMQVIEVESRGHTCVTHRSVTQQYPAGEKEDKLAPRQWAAIVQTWQHQWHDEQLHERSNDRLTIAANLWSTRILFVPQYAKFPDR